MLNTVVHRGATLDAYIYIPGENEVINGFQHLSKSSHLHTYTHTTIILLY